MWGGGGCNVSLFDPVGWRGDPLLNECPPPPGLRFVGGASERLGPELHPGNLAILTEKPSLLGRAPPGVPKRMSSLIVGRSGTFCCQKFWKCVLEKGNLPSGFVQAPKWPT